MLTESSPQFINYYMNFVVTRVSKYRIHDDP